MASKLEFSQQNGESPVLVYDVITLKGKILTLKKNFANQLKNQLGMREAEN